MKFAYADPPYLGSAEKLYGDLHSEAAEYDKMEAHQALINRLCEEFPDGWALSLHSNGLRAILPICPEDTRVLAWVKRNPKLKKGVYPIYAWEPILIRGGRRRAEILFDWIDTVLEVGFRRPNDQIIGMKPRALILYLFEALGMEPDDEFHDLFPGSGAVTRAWEQWRSQKTLLLTS